MIVADRQIPECLREGRVLSSLPLWDMNIVEVAKVYAYELWRTESAYGSHVNILLDEIDKLGRLRVDQDQEIIKLENELGDFEYKVEDLEDVARGLERQIDDLKGKISDLKDTVAYLEGESDADS